MDGEGRVGGAGEDRCPAHQFACLDGMRGIAAFAVLSAHSALLFTHTPRHYQLAVDFFFVLSGFVLTHAYEARLTAGMSTAGFLRLRLIRIYPLYVVASLLGFAHAAFASYSAEAAPLPNLIGRLGLALLLIPAPALSGEGWLYPLDAPAWSLLFELFANAVFAFFYQPLKRSPALMAAVMGASALALLGCGLFFGNFDLGWSSDNAIAGLPRVLFSFLAGVVLYRVWRRYASVRTGSWGPLLMLAAILTLHLSDPGAELCLQFLLIVFGFPVLVYWGAAVQSKPNAVRIFELLGLSSYAVYVLHLPIFFILRDVCAYFDINLEGTAPWGGIIFAAALFALCLLLDHVLDRPLRKVLQRLSRRDLPSLGELPTLNNSP